MRMAVSGSLRHIVWLQRFEGHTETNHDLCQKPMLCIQMRPQRLLGSCFWPSLFSLLICTVNSSRLFILDSLIFLGVEAWSMSSVRLSMSSELHVRCPLRLITVRLGVLAFQVRWYNHRISYLPYMHGDINIFFSTTLTVGQTGGLFSIVESLVSIWFTWISA